MLLLLTGAVQIFVYIFYLMDLRFGKPDEQVTGVENGGLFTREMCQRIAR